VLSLAEVAAGHVNLIMAKRNVAVRDLNFPPSPPPPATEPPAK